MTTCPGCGFHNLPGTPSCPRCRTSLESGPAVAVAELQPPRASGWSKTWRRGLRAIHVWEAPRRSRPLAPAAALLGLVPGLPSLARGRTRRALVFAGIWLLFVLAAIDGFGTPTGTILAGLALSCHALSALDPYGLALARMRFRRRVAASLAAYAALVAVVYYPANYLAARRFEALAATRAIPAAGIERGDLVLVRRRTVGEGWPARGELVAAAHGHQIVFDRVLGLPGDRVAVVEGALFRNGALVPPDEGPLEGRFPGFPIELTVPEGKVALWPYVALAELQPGNVPDLLLFLDSDLVGSVRGIYQPRGRRRTLE